LLYPHLAISSLPKPPYSPDAGAAALFFLFFFVRDESLPSEAIPINFSLVYLAYSLSYYNLLPSLTISTKALTLSLSSAPCSFPYLSLYLKS
jgi:hypothetical protein